MRVEERREAWVERRAIERVERLHHAELEADALLRGAPELLERFRAERLYGCDEQRVAVEPDRAGLVAERPRAVDGLDRRARDLRERLEVRAGDLPRLALVIEQDALIDRFELKQARADVATVALLRAHRRVHLSEADDAILYEQRAEQRGHGRVPDAFRVEGGA